MNVMSLVPIDHLRGIIYLGTRRVVQPDIITTAEKTFRYMGKCIITAIDVTFIKNAPENREVFKPRG